MESRNKLYGIDILRGIAILMVVLHHYPDAVFDIFILPWKGIFPDFSGAPEKAFFLTYPFQIGSMGVPLFFVLSGYCIQLSVQKHERTFSILEFYWKRFWRIYPPFLCAVLFFALMHGCTPWEFFTHVFFIQNISHDSMFGISGSFWSLSVEFQLYLVFPLLLYLLHRFGTFRAFVIVAIITVFFDYVMVRQDVVPYMRQSTPFAYWAFWSCGALLARHHAQVGPRFKYPVFWLVALAPVCVGFIFILPLVQYKWYIYTLYFTILLDWCVYFDWRPYRRILWPLWITGISSYSLYLLHHPLMWGISRNGLAMLGIPISGPTMVLLGLPFTFIILVACSYFTYRTVELPFIEMGKQNLVHLRRVKAYLKARFTGQTAPPDAVPAPAPGPSTQP